MIPIRDDQPTPCRPMVTYSIIGVTSLVFIWQFMIGFDNEAVFYIFGFVPGKYTLGDISPYFSVFNKLFSPITYMFFHGGFWHFLGNMWFLYIFGDNIECHFGSVRFLGFYLACGMMSAFCHLLLNFYSPVPTIGASGAIAGVMGAYFLLYPRAKILTLVPIIIIPIFIQIPAFIFLGIWFLFQFLNATGQGSESHIAWWAHVGGFITGFVLVQLNKRLPSTGARQKIDQFTQKKHTPKLQVIVPESKDSGPDLYGCIELSSLEAITGTRKMITIPWGFYKPLYRVKVPPGIQMGTRLKLKGMGKTMADKKKGALFLKVVIKNAF